MINYKIKLFSEIDPLYWDKHVQEFNGSIFYTYSYIKYLELCNKSRKIKNLSYVIFDGKRALSLVIIFIEKVCGRAQMTVGEYSIHSPLIRFNLSLDDFNFIKKEIKKSIIDLCKKYKCKLARFQVSAFNLLKNKNYKNFFYDISFSKNSNEKGWYDFQCNQSIIINLKEPQEKLRANIRNRYKSYINKTQKNDAELHIINSENLNNNLFSAYGKVHNQIKKNKRSIENLKYNFNLIKENKETIFLCCKNNKIIGAFVALHFNKMVYHNSSYFQHKDDNLYPNHYLFWHAIKYFHLQKYEYFHIGSKLDNNLENLPIKHTNLSFFKSGWGGMPIRWEHAEKKFY